LLPNDKPRVLIEWVRRCYRKVRVRCDSKSRQSVGKAVLSRVIHVLIFFIIVYQLKLLDADLQVFSRIKPGIRAVRFFTTKRVFLSIKRGKHSAYLNPEERYVGEKPFAADGRRLFKDTAIGHSFKLFMNYLCLTSNDGCVIIRMHI